MNGTQAGKKMMEMIAEGRKVEAIKTLRQIDLSSFNDVYAFVEAVTDAIEAMKPDAHVVELENYKKLREAGFSCGEAARIVDIINS